jgi:nitroreductase
MRFPFVKGGLPMAEDTRLNIASDEPSTGASSLACARSIDPILLPKPRADFGVSLAKALSDRRSVREFDAARTLSPQHLSELLWCGYGVNRNATGNRTAPSWRDAHEIAIFVAMEGGVWQYDPDSHRLVPHLAGDIRRATGIQDFVATAPLDLIYVCERDHLVGLSPNEQYRVASADTGFIGQNVYLYCASEGLATVFRTSFDHSPLARALRLGDAQFVTFVQSVGYPKT